MKSIEFEEKIKDVEMRFESAMSEFIRQSGYVEGTLDTIVAMMMDSCPEVAMTSDKLIRTFHGIEGICTSGLAKTFKDLLILCKDLDLHHSDSKELPEVKSDSLEESIALINKQKES